MGREKVRIGPILRYIKIFVLLGIVWTIADTHYVRRTIVREAAKRPVTLGDERIFIASIHWNNEAVLRNHWMPALVELAKKIGRNNVFVSVHESGSWDDTKEVLRTLENELAMEGIPRKITLDETTHAELINSPPGDEGWVETPRGGEELRRIPYLASLRNVALQPLYQEQNTSLRYDKILFLNDVVFTSHDVQNLMVTRGGNYAAACSLDFSNPPRFYDTFALRDSEGHEALMQEWPYFRAAESRKALKLSEAVPVSSCWNGMVVMDAAPFYDETPLQFRGIADSLAASHLEGSECCLIHADNSLSMSKGVWLNPNVRVAYTGPGYEAMNPVQNPWVSTTAIYRGLWQNRILRWLTTTRIKDTVVGHRLTLWKDRFPASAEAGAMCLINEMQVLVANGWAHV